VGSGNTRIMTFASHLAPVHVRAKHKCSKMCGSLGGPHDYMSGGDRDASMKGSYIEHTASSGEWIVDELSRCCLLILDRKQRMLRNAERSLTCA
jgi:hypothetical protein